MLRSNFVKAMREFYWKNEFVEVDTPVLVNAASGALATPFKTHHEAYDIDVFMRIATETFLKECIVGGFDRVFEVGRIFRNEGLDPSHLQDFTMVEHYAAYWDYKKNMEFTEQMLATLLQDLTGSTKVKIPDRDGKLQEVDFTPPWPKWSIREAILNACGVDIQKSNSSGALREAMKLKKIHLDSRSSVWREVLDTQAHSQEMLAQRLSYALASKGDQWLELYSILLRLIFEHRARLVSPLFQNRLLGRCHIVI
jgi:lysyl-tRNA synthetase class 2